MFGHLKLGYVQKVDPDISFLFSSWIMETALFAICSLLIVKRSKEYFASEIVFEKTFLRNMNNGLVDE